jgi:hypothetical protein
MGKGGWGPALSLLLLLAFLLPLLLPALLPEVHAILAPVDVWTNKGGQGPWSHDGEYTVGESITIYCEAKVHIPVLRIVLIRPDGSEVVALELRDVQAGTYSVSGTVGEPTGEWIARCWGLFDDFIGYDDVRFTVQQRTPQPPNAKFRAIVEGGPGLESRIVGGSIMVMVLQVLDGLDGGGRLKFGDRITVSDFRTNSRCSPSNQAQIDDVTYSLPYRPLVEVYGYYEGTPMIIDCAPGYVRNLSADDLIFSGEVVSAHDWDIVLKISTIAMDRYKILSLGEVVFVDASPCYEQHICPVDIPVNQGDNLDVRGKLYGIQRGYGNVQQEMLAIYVLEPSHYLKKAFVIAKVYIKSVILNRVSATTQTGLFIAIGPRKISEIVGEPVAWMPGLGVWASITVENKDTKSFDGYLKVFLKSPSGRTYETAKGIVHIDPEKEETYFAPIYYYDIFSGVRGTETGLWHVYVELFEGIFIPLSKKIDDAGPIDLMVVKDEVFIAPDPYFWSAGDVIPIDDFIKADKPSIIEKYYEPLNLFFLIMQALAKVKSPETLNTILPSPTGVSDPSIISGALAGSTDFDVKIKDLGRNIYNIIVTYTVKPYDITVFGKNYHFVNWYDRVHVELTFPSIFEVIDAGDAYSHVTYEDGKTYVAWFDIYCDKLLYPTPGSLQRTKSHSIKVSIKDPISASAIVEGYAYFEVGPFDSTSLKSFPIINYQKWKENPSEIAWILFVTKRDQEIISLVPTETGNLATLKPVHISTNSTVIKVTSDRENQKIVIKLEGPSATRGFMNITIAKDLALLGSKQPVIKVYFDGNPQSYKLVELDGSLLISLEYTHPIYTLELYYGSKAPQEIADFKTLGILITVAILLSTATTYFLYRRRRGTDKFYLSLFGRSLAMTHVVDAVLNSFSNLFRSHRYPPLEKIFSVVLLVLSSWYYLPSFCPYDVMHCCNCSYQLF